MPQRADRRAGHYRKLFTTLALGALIAAIYLATIRSSTLTRILRLGSTQAPVATASLTTMPSVAPSTKLGTYPKGELYFLSHGGPPTMFETESAPYKAWQKFGKLIAASKPRGIVVISAHWENPDSESKAYPVVNTDTTNPLVYDFYGFPKNYYEQKFASRGDPVMLADIKAALGTAGSQFSLAKRGLDHGVWVPFLVAFEGGTDIPIIQVSLPGDGNPVSSARLGQALKSLRDQGYAIMGSGQAVHNLRDYMHGAKASYGKPFLDAVNTALHSSSPLDTTLRLFSHPMFRQAHPTPEHFLPLAVVAGVIDETDVISDIFVQPNGALGWGMWSWKNTASTTAASA